VTYATGDPALSPPVLHPAIVARRTSKGSLVTGNSRLTPAPRPVPPEFACRSVLRQRSRTAHGGSAASPRAVPPVRACQRELPFDQANCLDAKQAELAPWRVEASPGTRSALAPNSAALRPPTQLEAGPQVERRAQGWVSGQAPKKPGKR